MKENHFKPTDYSDIGNKSVWQLYVENFRDHLFDMCPSIGFLNSDEDLPSLPEETPEETPEDLEESENKE